MDFAGLVEGEFGGLDGDASAFAFPLQSAFLTLVAVGISRGG